MASASSFDWSAIDEFSNRQQPGSIRRKEVSESPSLFTTFDALSPPDAANQVERTPTELDSPRLKRVSFAEKKTKNASSEVKKLATQLESASSSKNSLKATSPAAFSPSVSHPPRGSILDRPSGLDGRRTSQFAFEERLDVVRGVMSQSIEDLLQAIPDFDEDQKRALRGLTDCREKAFQKEYPSLHPTASSSSSIFNTALGDHHADERRLRRMPKGPTRMLPELPKTIPKPPPANWLEEKRQLRDRRVLDNDDLSSSAPKEYVYLPLKELNDSQVRELMPQQSEALAELTALGLL